MELWNDFEGKVVDDRFRLGRLLAPKGRSAFFAATTLSGEPITMRLIESLNDEDEILARWRVVEGIREEHLQRLAACGKTVLDGTHLVYAVLEPTEMALDEVLRERALTGEETRQMAGAVVGALEALHQSGLVHEHVDAASVLARGETVKLRSDCVREAPEGVEGETLRRRDAHDLAMLVGYALTRRRDVVQGSLPRQFEDLVRNGMSGTWGMKEMSALLRPATATAPVPPAPAGTRNTPAGGPKLVESKGPASGPGVVPGRPGVVGPGTGPGLAGPGVAGSGVASPAAGVGTGPGLPGRIPGVAAAGTTSPPLGKPALAEPGRVRSTSPTAVASALDEEEQAVPEPMPGRRVVLEPEEAPQRFPLAPWIGAGVVALLLVLLIVHFAHGGASNKAAVAPAMTPATQTVVTPKPTAAAPAPGRSVTVAPARVEGSGTWRVIAYTYMHREQAQHKAETISARHPELRATVYAPGGRAPFLVALGGGMTEREALKLRERARREGLPRDTFVRNYHGR